MAGLERLTARIYGRVQGVFFRAFVTDKASRLGIAGYARNMPDGSVEVEAEGDRDRLEQLLADLRIGPRHARVDRVDASWSPAGGKFSSFEAL